MGKPHKLTQKQENFCWKYIETGNAHAAYIKAYDVEYRNQKDNWTYSEASLLLNRTLKLALDELVNKNFLIITRQGGKNQCSLYALTCIKLNNISKNGIVIQKETIRPLDSWKTQN